MDITYLLRTINRTILEQHLGMPRRHDFQGIILLKNQSKLLERYLYIGHYSDGVRLLSQCPSDTSITMFLSADDVNQVKLPPCGSHNLIVSTLDILDLYNRIHIILQNYLHWTSTLQQALCSGQTLPQLLNVAAEMIQSPIYLLNPGYKLIAGSSLQYFDEALGTELFRHGTLSFDTVQNLHGLMVSLQPDTGESRFYLAVLENIRYHICEIHTGSRHIATILLAENPQHGGIDYHHLLTDFSGIAAHTLLENLEALLSQDSLLCDILDCLIEERLTDTDEIQSRLGELCFPVKLFCAIVLIRLEKQDRQDVPLGILMQQLQAIFPETNMTLFHDDIVILHSQDLRPLDKLDFDYDRLFRLLKQCHAHAGISNGSRQCSRLRTLYTLAAATIRLGKSLHRFSSSERVFSYEDYSMYYIIDLCAKQYIDTHHHNDLIYLIHPSIIKICRYDAEHKSNLRDVLYYYLLGGCNLSRTAQNMYMHRNTVLNKLNKINEIAEIPLEDGYTQHRMIMSCLIMRYYEEYLHIKVRL